MVLVSVFDAVFHKDGISRALKMVDVLGGFMVLRIDGTSEILYVQEVVTLNKKIFYIFVSENEVNAIY